MQRQFLQLEASAANALIAIRKAVDAELDEYVAALRKETADADDELRDNLSYVLAGSERDRWIGAGLLFAGILLAVAGSVVGTLS